MKTNKELKAEYKLMKFPAGVYQIRNTKNGKIFIDSSTQLDKVWNSKRFQLELGGHPNRNLQADWNTFGEENFVFEILDEVAQLEDERELDFKKEAEVLKELFLEELQPFGEKGYNQKPRI